MTAIAKESFILGRHGEIQAGEEIPPHYQNDHGEWVKTDLARLEELGLVKRASLKRGRKPKATDAIDASERGRWLLVDGALYERVGTDRADLHESSGYEAKSVIALPGHHVAAGEEIPALVPGHGDDTPVFPVFRDAGFRDTPVKFGAEISLERLVELGLAKKARQKGKG